MADNDLKHQIITSVLEAYLVSQIVTTRAMAHTVFGEFDLNPTQGLGAIMAVVEHFVETFEGMDVDANSDILVKAQALYAFMSIAAIAMIAAEHVVQTVPDNMIELLPQFPEEQA